mmetsp:Transcript_36050/g.85350  ORF Transcript_36050/g.85350 Transcript_36050/m.85350 type:complete len:201 (-) Transcript_36050:299-901(-)
MQDVVSCPAKRNVFNPSRSSIRDCSVHSRSSIPATILSRMSLVANFSPALSAANFRCSLALTLSPMYVLRRRTPFRCRNHAGVGVYCRSGNQLRSLHSSMMGRYRSARLASHSSGVRLNTALPITWRVAFRNTSAMSTGSSFAATASSSAKILRVTSMAAAPTSPRISSLNVGASCRRSWCQRSPSESTMPFPRRQSNAE